jgi:hypothetical protein
MKKRKTPEIDDVHPCDIIAELFDDMCSGGRLVSKRRTRRLVQIALQRLANIGYRLEVRQ